MVNEDYVRTARAKGLSESLLLSSMHVEMRWFQLDNLFSIGGAIGGAVLTESIAFYGMGNVAVDAIINLDYSVLWGDPSAIIFS